MNSSKKYYISLDFIRVLSCIAILLYHLNILKGGYLAVCTFFCLSGYLSYVSAFKKEKFSLKSYYSNRLLKLYIPVIALTFITIAIVSLIPQINWLNLKPETTSVLLGYNNFWQLSANLDYFARHINSPFIHLWYISILLQFDLVFPFIYMLFRKIGDKIHKICPVIISLILSVIFFIYFYKTSMTQNIMVAYYNTFSRIFSLFFGLSLGLIHSYFSPLIPKISKNKYFNKIIFGFYLLVLITLFICIDAKSEYFPVSMLLSTLITCRLIDYGTLFTEGNNNWFKKIIKFISGISYEVYLVQYPVIFLFQYIDINCVLKYIVMVIIIFIISYILHICLAFKKDEKNKVINWSLRIFVLAFTLCGLVQYVLAKDYTSEMKQLEQQLADNQKILEQKQKEYEMQFKEEQERLEQMLNDLENGKNNLDSIISNLPIVGIGDSVMLGAVDNLYDIFPNGYFDAETSRTAWVVNGILQKLENRKILGDAIVLNLGANGDCPERIKNEIMERCKGRKVFWLNVTNDSDVHVNSDLLTLASKYSNLHVIDWNSISKNHPEYFIADKIHLTAKGKEVFAKVIYDSIYQVYLDEYNAKKEEILKEHDEAIKNKISFYGNNILLNALEYVQEDYTTARFNVNNNYDYETLKKDIEKEIENNTITDKIVFIFDDKVALKKGQYKELLNLLGERKIYILSVSEKNNNELSNIDNENLLVLNFYQEILNNNNYLMIDKTHLSKEGNEGLKDFLKTNLE